VNIKDPTIKTSDNSKNVRIFILKFLSFKKFLSFAVQNQMFLHRFQLLEFGKPKVYRSISNPSSGQGFLSAQFQDQWGIGYGINEL